MLTVEMPSNAAPKLKLLLYGKPGVGKTSLALTATDHPDMAPVMLADIEGGLLPVVNDRFRTVRISSTNELDELYAALYRREAKFDDIETLIVDSGSMAADRALIEWSARNMERDQARGKRNKIDRTIDDVELGDYGKMTVQIARLMSWLVSLPINVIITAIEKENFRKSTGQGGDQILESIGPKFTKNLGDRLMGLVDHVWYLYAEDGTRYLLTQRSGYYEAKTRRQGFAEAIGEIVESPNLAELYQTLLDTSHAPE